MPRLAAGLSRPLPWAGGMEQASEHVASQLDTANRPWALAANLDLVRQTVLIAAGYFLCYWIGVSFASEQAVSVVWPPSGFALAVMYRYGGRAIAPLWVADALASFYFNDVSPLTAALLPIRTVAEPLIAILLLRLVGFDRRLRRLRDIAALVLVGAPISTLLNALCTIYVMGHLGAMPWPDYWEHALLYWVGNAGGVLTLAPGLLILFDRTPQSATMQHWLEALFLSLLAFVVLQVPVILPNLPDSAVITYFIFPMVAWIALRVPRRLVSGSAA